MSSRRTPRRTNPQHLPTCKVRGDSPKNYHLSTRKPRKQVVERVTTRIENPPQAQLLAEEYVHNLEQQLYFLDAELRFLHDRSGVDENPNGTSVDSAIRRLRRACAMHEEETNKKIEMLRKLIEEKKAQIGSIDENQAEEHVEKADNHEREAVDQLKTVFIDMASKIHMHQLQKDHYDNASEFNEDRRESMTNALSELKNRRESLEDDLRKLNDRIDEIKHKRKDLLKEFSDSVRRKRNNEEEADLLVIVGNETEPPPPNQPLSAVKTRASKVANDLANARATREELEQQMDRLLDKNVRLKAELNDIKARVERAKNLKGQLDRQYEAKYGGVKAENSKLREELAQIKAQRKDLKKEFKKSSKKFDEFIAQINQRQAEQQLLMEVISFKTNEKQKIDAENDMTRSEIAALTDDLRQMREEFEDLTKMLSEATEKKTRVETLVNLHNEDPRCKMENVPPEMAQLLDSLNAVNEKLD